MLFSEPINFKYFSSSFYLTSLCATIFWYFNLDVRSFPTVPILSTREMKQVLVFPKPTDVLQHSDMCFLVRASAAQRHIDIETVNIYCTEWLDHSRWSSIGTITENCSKSVIEHNSAQLFSIAPLKMALHRIAHLTKQEIIERVAICRGIQIGRLRQEWPWRRAKKHFLIMARCQFYV